ncbi:Serine/arginine-rich protein RS2Z32 [Heracleum sosnowskyi]|uniref:Serine/arginine-rich protein RS2Z32 n=1 Tax=Heracleum sosnowskyi TaxID=360622 RepID=A0AAD8N392_9APIA|nr:Serine/arginine-rich protein RS2Z32 [Heracleum sosnowskyi]
MSYSRRSRYSRSPSPYRRYKRSVSRSRSYDSTEVENPGNNLYVTGLSPRITKRDIEKHFSTQGKVEDVHLVVDPWSRESRGFGFVTMSSVEEAERCIKYLDRSVLEGRVIMVEKAKRRRGRTPTPGRYLGLREVRGRRRSPSYSPYHRSRSSSLSSERGDADQSPTRVLAPHTADPRSAGVVITGTILLMMAPTGEAATALLHRASPREGIGIQGDIPAASLPGALRGDIHQVSLQACPLLEDDEAIHISVDTLRIAVPLGVVVSVHLMHPHTQGLPPHPRCE